MQHTLTKNVEQAYSFATLAEADATYLVIAWFAITESASLGIFPLLSALETARKTDPSYFTHFFEDGFQHFTDEQHHANLWCRALLDFTEKYPEVVKRVKLPSQYLRIMLKSIGKPHHVTHFSVDCLAFEIVMQALYDVMQARLAYPPVKQIMNVISADEFAHTGFGRARLKDLPKSGQDWRLAFRYWRNTLGVLITIGPVLKALDKLQPLAKKNFQTRLNYYLRTSGIAGSEGYVPKLLMRLV